MKTLITALYNVQKVKLEIEYKDCVESHQELEYTEYFSIAVENEEYTDLCLGKAFAELTGSALVTMMTQCFDMSFVNTDLYNEKQLPRLWAG